MMNLLKSEIMYFKIPLGIIVLLPLIFAVYAFSNIILFNDIYFLGKYFWSMFVGLGVYAFVFIIWVLREKEQRDRMHYLIPIPIRRISISRWFFGAGPIILVVLFLEVINTFLPIEQTVFADRILIQLGLLFIFLASFEVVMYLDKNLSGRLIDKIGWIKIGAALILTAISLGIIALVTAYLEDGTAKYIFIGLSIVIFTFSSVLHSKRKKFI